MAATKMITEIRGGQAEDTVFELHGSPRLREDYHEDGYIRQLLFSSHNQNPLTAKGAKVAKENQHLNHKETLRRKPRARKKARNCRSPRRFDDSSADKKHRETVAAQALRSGKPAIIQSVPAPV
jgi:hypothetical protein